MITNAAHPFEGGEALFYNELIRKYDVSNAVINPSSPIIHDPNWKGGQRSGEYRSGAQRYLLVPDWTADKVMAFDPQNGNLLDADFIPSNGALLASPKQARLSPRGTITVSDQIQDLVQNFDTSGVHIGIMAPAGGVNTTILDNIRGHSYRPNGRLVVAVGSGGNQNAIAEFDSVGNYIGQFITAGAGGLNSPFCVLFRSTDVLVTGASTPTGVHRYDLNGGYLSNWTSFPSFPQQIIALSSGNFAIANFQGTGETGIRIHSPNGTFMRLLSGVTGNRGVYQLGNGNFLTTNAAGVHEIDSSNGTLVRTVITGTSLQYIDLVNPYSLK